MREKIGKKWEGLDVWADTRYPYIVLPATETASKEYQEKYKIKTSKVATQFDGNYSGKWDDVEVNPIYGDVAYEYDTIVECYSYTFEEYIEMFHNEFIHTTYRFKFYKSIY